MEAGWANTIQMVLLALATLYLRSGSKKDSRELDTKTSSPEQVARLQADVTEMKIRLEQVEKNTTKADEIDHRKPG